jgi:hypothetical protein
MFVVHLAFAFFEGGRIYYLNFWSLGRGFLAWTDG